MSLLLMGAGSVGVAAPSEPVVIVITTSQTWPVPADWNPSNNIIHAIGPGGASGGVGESVCAGGGGAHSFIENFDFGEESEAEITIGNGGLPGGVPPTATVFHSGHTLVAVGGANGDDGGAGGQAISCFPVENAHNGGHGFDDVEGGGGGAAGPDGDGVSATNSNGGAGNDGQPGGGGRALPGFNGNPGELWTSTVGMETVGPGGGGGGFDPPGDGGFYGGGGGCGPFSDGSGAPGLVVIIYTPL